MRRLDRYEIEAIQGVVSALIVFVVIVFIVWFFGKPVPVPHCPPNSAYVERIGVCISGASTPKWSRP